MFIPPAGYPLSDYTPPVTGQIPPPIPILADHVDPVTNAIDSLAIGADPTDAAIQWQFTIRQNEGPANGDGGHRLHLVTKATEQAPVQIADEGRRVMAPFVRRGDVRDVEALGDTPGGSTPIGALEVRYTNTYTGATARAGGA